MATVPNFFYHPRIMEYDFGHGHPLRPERLKRTMSLLTACAEIDLIDPGLATDADVLRLHSKEYVDAVKMAGGGDHLPGGFTARYGIGPGDTPAFIGMYEVSLAYVGGSIRAAEAVRDGADLAFGIGGGLHHAQRGNASGFCVFNDVALACSVLRERFDRVAYVDIDVHHGDGVEALFADDPTVMTCSIHQMSPGFYPGTGRAEETGTAGTTVNIPLPNGTTGEVWLDAFRRGIIPLLEEFDPGAIVLQMGTDPHFDDPLARLQVSAQEWLGAVESIRDLGKPICATGGGGYNLSTVPRMWVAAVLTLSGIPVPERIPEPDATEYGTPTFFDPELPQPRGIGFLEAERALSILRAARPKGWQPR